MAAPAYFVGRDSQKKQLLCSKMQKLAEIYKNLEEQRQIACWMSGKTNN